jgi:hypothetical protein
MLLLAHSGGVRLPAKKSSKITVLLDPSEAERFDAYCTARGFKKSTLIALLVREHLDKEGFQQGQPTPSPNSGARR